MSGPEPAELRQPGIHFLKWFWLETVKTALCIHGGLYEAGLAQHSQMLGHGRLRHTELTLDVPNRLLRQDEQPQYCAAVRLGNDLEHRFHAFSYTLWDIYVSRYIKLFLKCRNSDRVQNH